ncbi:hypothetical protein DYB32_010800 [Aphanomyces invadans]|uniref:LNR domain-containing protein n=1 Tax=Aphanomyces invadans TaxID=157072 RepID=A0A418AF01_9STRA|nr:hypothetical protein DYB32_010800 [Aphanomyces invadans]
MDCHTLHNASLDVDDVLDPATIGSALFILQVSRCDIPNGISNTSLARQPGLFAITLQFTKMHSWPGTLPPTTASIVLRQCAFSTIPAILEKVLPATMRILIVESTPLASLPLQISRLWHPLASLQLINTSLRELPMAITSLANLNSLSLFNNRIQHVPVAWQSQLNALPNFRSLNLAANDLTELPTMLRTDIDVDLSLNPIGSLPQGLDLNRLLKLKLSHTSYCNETYPSPPSICAASACAHACQFSMVGDRNCDVGCFNAACDFDGTDCKEYGLEPP